MTTVGDLVQATRRELFGMHRPEYNKLDVSTTDSATSITLTLDNSSLQSGSYVAINDELMLVWSIAGQSLEVQRGMLGTVAAAHDAGSLVECNPRFPDFAIRDALKKEIKSWEPRLFAVATIAADVASGKRDAELAGVSDWYSILKVVRSPKVNQKTWYPIGYRAQRDLDTDAYASGSAIFLNDSAETAITLRITYAAPFDVSTFEDSTDLADVGLSVDMEDIAPMGAAWRLVAGREIKRNFLEEQGEPRNAQEVPAGAIFNSARGMKMLRDERIKDAALRLRELYPFRQS